MVKDETARLAQAVINDEIIFRILQRTAEAQR